MRKIISIWVVVLLLGTFVYSFAISTGKQMRESSFSGEMQPKVITEYINAINNQDVNGIISLFPSEEEEEWISYFADIDREHVGVRSILDARISFVEPLGYELLLQNTDIDYYIEKYGETVSGYIVGTILDVTNEDAYFHDGLNVHLVIIANEDGREIIAEYSEASLFLLTKMFDAQRIKNDKDLQSVFRYKEAKSQGRLAGGETDY